MKTAMLLTFLLLATPGVRAAGVCEDTFTKAPAELDQVRFNYNKALTYLESYKGISAGVGQADLVFRKRRFAWQPDVSLKISWRGRKKLVVRDVADSPLGIWRVAEGLYQAQVLSRLFSPQQNAREYTGPVNGDDAFEYFFAQMPVEWQQDRVKLLGSLNAEMYQLFEQLGLSENQILPAHDPGHFSIWRMLRGANSKLYVGPNRADFAQWKLNGDPGVDRHSKRLLFDYYWNIFNRFMRVTLVLQILATPQVMVEVPTAFDAWLSEIYQQTQPLDPRLLSEATRLEKEIAAQKSSGNPDQSIVDADTAELQVLMENDPRIPYAAP